MDPMEILLLEVRGMRDQLGGMKTENQKMNQKVTDELDGVRSELASINDKFKRDEVRMGRLEKNVEKLNEGLFDNSQETAEINAKVTLIDNTTNKNKERIEKLENLMKGMSTEKNEAVFPPLTFAETVKLGIDTVQGKKMNDNGKKKDKLEKLEYTILSKKTNIAAAASSDSSESTEIELDDIFKQSRSKIGLFPMKSHHILYWCKEKKEAADIDTLEEERKLAAVEFLDKELKCKENILENILETKWSEQRNILWITLKSEREVREIFQRQARLRREKIKLITHIPHFCYERNRDLEINCRIARETNSELRTQIRLGKRDLVLMCKKKGDRFYSPQSDLEMFGEIAAFNFDSKGEMNFSLGTPEGRRNSSEDESDVTTVVKKASKRKNEENTGSSPADKVNKFDINNISHDNSAVGLMESSSPVSEQNIVLK